MNPYVVIATHKRLLITKKNVECLLHCNVGVILIVSDEGEMKVFKQFFPGITIIQHQNYPLGLKWQAGVEAAKGLKADPLIINGSDDILCKEFFTRATGLLEEGYHFIGLRSWYVYDPIDKGSVYKFDYLANIPLGGGRVYSKALMEYLKHEIFDVRKERHLDDLGYHGVLKSNMRKIVLAEPLILSVKGDWQVMNPLNAMFGSRNAMLRETIYSPTKILEQFNYG